MGEIISFADRRVQAQEAVVTQVTEALPVITADAPLPVLKGEGGSEVFDYATITRHALLGIVRTILANVSKHGLAQSAQLYLTFDTRVLGCEMPAWLRQRHAERMTILLDQWWQDLEVTETAFTVTLNFSDTAATLTVPFAALESFADTSCNFGLGFAPVVTEESAPTPPSAA